MKSLKIGMLGFGVVGSGVVRALQNNAELIEQRIGRRLELVKVVVRNLDNKRGADLPAELLTTNVDAVLEDPQIDIVIELIGGYEPAKDYILKAIAQGKHVVTANKALMAVHGQEIIAAAEKQGVSVMFEASVAGGIPVITAIKENLCVNRFSTILGILNGTCNYILTKMTEEGGGFAPILKEAQELGYAEADPTFDVEGIDTAHKIALLSALCFGTNVDFNKVYIEGISRIEAIDIDFATKMGYKIKLLAVGKNHGDQIEVRVHPTMIPKAYQLAEVDGVFNAVRINGDFVGPAMFYGKGAGMEATASAVMGDVLAVARDISSGAKSRVPVMGYVHDAIASLPIRAMSDIHSHYYLRFTTLDRPGVLSQISSCLGRHNISIQSMLQPETLDNVSVPIVLMTHEAQEVDIVAALAEIDQLEIIAEPTRLIRVENDPD
jgi:homoserine dehydrogenase